MIVIKWSTLFFFIKIIIIQNQAVNQNLLSLEAIANKLDLSDVDMSKFFNRSAVEVTTGLNKKINMIANDLSWASLYDFTSTIRDFSCSQFICEQSVLNSICQFNAITRMPRCLHCSFINTDFQQFCLFKGQNSIINLEKITTTYKSLTALTNKLNFLITNNSDVSHMLKIIRYTVPLYYFTFNNNTNEYYEYIAYINHFLFNRTDFTKLNYTNETLFNETSKFIEEMLRYSVYSLGFNYGRFIQLFVRRNTSENSTNFFQYGRNTSLVNPFGVQEIYLGNLSVISRIKEHEKFGTGINYYTFGLPDMHNLIKITFPYNMNRDIFLDHYPRIVNNEWKFSLKYIVSYIFNNNAYYTPGGLKPVTPVITIGLTDYINDYEDYALSPRKSYTIQIITPWSYEKMIFSMGDIISNCNVIKWSHEAQHWFPSIHSAIDKNNQTTTETQVSFTVNSLGTFAIDCDYYIQRNSL